MLASPLVRSNLSGPVEPWSSQDFSRGCAAEGWRDKEGKPPSPREGERLTQARESKLPRSREAVHRSKGMGEGRAWRRRRKRGRKNSRNRNKKERTALL